MLCDRCKSEFKENEISKKRREAGAKGGSATAKKAMRDKRGKFVAKEKLPGGGKCERK